MTNVEKMVIDRLARIGYFVGGERVSRDVAHAILGDNLAVLEGRWLASPYDGYVVGCEVNGHSFSVMEVQDGRV
jgi:hypothetical protein